MSQRRKPAFEEARCIGCRCTDSCACPEGCSWLRVNYDIGTGVCSRCPTYVLQWDKEQARPKSVKRATRSKSR